MGFFGGFFTGFALTTSMLYLTIQVHRSNRIDQRNAIREQTEMLNWLASSMGAYDRRLLPKEDTLSGNIPSTQQPSQPPTMKDMLKHRWNEEVKKLATRAYESRWEDARDTAVEGWKSVRKLVRKE